MTPVWIRDLQHFLKRVAASLPGKRFSNFAEQELIDRYVADFRIAEKSRVCVDIGAGDGIRSSNSFHLLKRGWSGLCIEADPDKFARLRKVYKGRDDVRLVDTQVTPMNVVDTVRASGVEGDIGVLSLDIDGYDYWVLKSILQSFRPSLIVTEVNEKIPPPIKFVIHYSPDWRLQHHFYGYSIAQLEELITEFDYSLLALEYNNAFLAPKEIAGEGLPPEEAYRIGYLEREDRLEKFPENRNMEPLLTLPPDEAVGFLNDFFREREGKYSIEAGTAG